MCPTFGGYKFKVWWLQKTNQMAPKIVFFLVAFWNEFCSFSKKRKYGV
jgi:hypothetical protein